MGLGSRVTAMANGLIRGGSVMFYWRRNDHCPEDWSRIFPNGIPGIEIVTDQDGAGLAKWEIPITAYDRNADDTMRLQAYNTIMAAMVDRAAPAVPVGIHIRCCRYQTSCSPQAMANAAAAAWHVEPGKPVVVLADAARGELNDALWARGLVGVAQKCRPLAADLARSPDSVIAYALDWQRLCRCRTVITNCPESAALHPLRSRGAEIIPVLP